jgi:predicted transcriptional regulator
MRGNKMTFNEEYPDELFIDKLSKLSELSGKEFIRTHDIADAVGCCHQEAKYRLHILEAKELVISKKEASCGKLGFRYLWKLSGNETPKELEKPARKSQRTRALVLSMMSTEEPIPFTQLMADTGLSYVTLARYLHTLQKEGKVAQIKYRNSIWQKTKEDETKEDTTN